MRLHIWIAVVCIISNKVVCAYFDEFGESELSPTTVIYHPPLKKYPLWSKNFFQNELKSSSSKIAPSFSKFSFDSSPSLLSLEQGLIDYTIEPPKQQFRHSSKLLNKGQFQFFDPSSAIDHIQSGSTDSPIETEVYHVHLPPIIVDQNGKYHRVPPEVLQDAMKGVQASTRLHPGVAQYAPPDIPIHTQFPANQGISSPNYVHQRPTFHQLPKQQLGIAPGETPIIHYHPLPQSHSYAPRQPYFPARNEHLVRYPPYTTNVGYATQLPPRSAAKPLLTEVNSKAPDISSGNHTSNVGRVFSQRDDGVFGSLRGVQPIHNSPQGRSDFPILPNRQRLYDDNPALYNSPIFRLNKHNGIPKCANGTNITFCLTDSEYPSEVVRLSMNNNQFLLERILADPSDSSSIKLVEGLESSNTSSNRQLEQESDNITQTEDGNYICPSTVTYSKLLRAANVDGEWKVVVNLKKTHDGAKYSQTVRLEQCTNPEVPCNFLNGAIDSRCVQKYNLQRLLVWSYEEGIHFDVFKLPIACSCQLRKPGDAGQ